MIEGYFAVRSKGGRSNSSLQAGGISTITWELLFLMVFLLTYSTHTSVKAQVHQLARKLM
jgi:hypothetical protein